MQSEFGIFIPLNPLRQIFRRAEKAGYFENDAGILYRKLDACNNLGLNESRKSMSAMQQDVVAKMQSFALKAHKTELTAGQAEEMLLGFISDHGLEIIYHATDQSVIQSIRPVAKTLFIVADYLTHCQANDQITFEQIGNIAKGAMLVNALYLPDQSKINQKFKGTTVYLDSQIVAYCLGYAGEDRRRPIIELLDLLKLYGASLGVFSHTIDEVRRIMDACAAKVRRQELHDSFGPIMEHFIVKGYQSTDIDLFSARLEVNLDAIGIKVQSKPPYTQKYNIAEKDLEIFLENEIGYRNPKALEHDVDCLAAIARIRRGRHSFSFENSGAVFVSTNFELARASRSFFQAELPNGAVTLCITDSALGNLLWLKNPAKAPNLPQRLLIADTYAALQPSDELWKSYLVEITKLERDKSITSDDYMLLRHHQSAKRALMDLTKGTPSAFTEGTVAEILEIAKRHVRADLELKLVGESTERHSLEQKLRGLSEERDVGLVHIERISINIANIITAAFYYIIIGLLLLGSIYTFPWSLPAVKDTFFEYVLSVAQVLLLVSGMLSAKSGRTLDSFREKVNNYLANRIRIKIIDVVYPKIQSNNVDPT